MRVIFNGLRLKEIEISPYNSDYYLNLSMVHINIILLNIKCMIVAA